MRESNPVCIDQNGRTTKAFSELVGTIEVVAKNLNALAEGIFPLTMVRQSADSVFAIEQEPRSVLPGVAESASDHDRHRRFLHPYPLVISLA
jgi:hypothetical protein